MRSPGYAKIALLLVAFGTVAAIGFLCGIALDQKYEFEPWLKRWETLTAGALAVAAAFVTVAAMLQQDEKQQERHEQLLNLALRGDAIKAQRASKFIEVLRDFETISIRDLEEDEKATVEIRQRTRNLIKAAENLNLAVERATGARSLEDSYQIFDAETAYAYDALYTVYRRTVTDLIEWKTDVENTVGGGEKLIRIGRDVRRRIENLGGYSRQLSDELERLCKTYASPIR